MHRALRRSLSLVLTTSLATLVSAQEPAPAIRASERAFRLNATARVMPEYPATSVARRADGVAVAQVRTGLDDRVERVDVLQSPDADIAEAVRVALLQWAAPSPQVLGRTTKYVTEAKTTFYFVIRNGKGFVLNPDQMPGNEDVFPPRVRAAVNAGGGAPPVRMMEHASDGVAEIDEGDLRSFLADETTLLLDVRDRAPFAASSRPRAINIPRDELLVRSRAELPHAAQVVIDCSQEATALCRFSASYLRERGFEKVAIYIP